MRTFLMDKINIVVYALLTKIYKDLNKDEKFKLSIN